MDKYLKFASQKEAEFILFDKVEDGLVPKLDFVADVVGIIYKETGKMLSSVEGEYPEAKPVAGWHVNLRGPDADKFPSYEVTVNTPSRNWF
jgi:hypothetical protein